MNWKNTNPFCSPIIAIWITILIFSVQATNRATTTIDPPTVRKCRVDNFIVQKNFNSSLYQGHWFLISWNKHELEIEHSFLSKFVGVRNIEIHYTRHPNGSYRILTGSMKFHMFCLQEETIAHVMNKSAPQKLMVHRSPKLQYPYWILQTDYTGYAIVYSCLKTAPNGMCAPGHTIVQTLNRKPTGHTQAQQMKVDNIVRRVCVDPSEMRIGGYDGRCPELDPQSFPQHKILIEAICLMFVLTAAGIGIAYLVFCRSSGDSKRKKEHTK